MSQVVLITADGGHFVVDADVAEGSELIKHMMLDLEISTDKIPLPNVRTEVMSKVLEYCAHYKGQCSELPIPGGSVCRNPTADIPPWDRQFLEVEFPMLFQLVIAANYLDIPRLLHVACKAIANVIRGKSTEELRTLMGIVNDFSPDEERQIRRENSWAESR
ncbi:E3 ubiquitin ligase SCF complex, Skp subunit [Panus rudis PR-1116 ss-1]|nr:E3 ubiquitin ligase SCF complex, Skp subunit [Panus rudis PR-1116 ss-1]